MVEKKQDTREACKSRYYKLKAKGLCVKCGKNKAEVSRTLCLGCKKVHNKRAVRYYMMNKSVMK